MAEKCNEEAKRMEMIEEVTLLASMLDFKQGIKVSQWFNPLNPELFQKVVTHTLNYFHTLSIFY